MRVSSLRKDKLKKITNTTLFFVVIIGIGLLLPRLFSIVAVGIMTPVQWVNQWYETSEQGLPVLLREKQSLEAEIQVLKNELVVAQQTDITTRRLQDENNRLRMLLGAKGSERLLARVVARPNELPYDFLQIDQGSIDGIEENALVYIGTDTLIGVVSQVRPNHSFVQLFTTPGVEMTGFIAGPDVVATIEGVGGGVARVKVPQGIPLSIGNLVYVPSVEPGLFGQIEYIESRPSQPEQFGYITLSLPLQSVYEVAVSKHQIEPASVDSINANKTKLIRERLLREEAHTVSFEELQATSTDSTVELDEVLNEE